MRSSGARLFAASFDGAIVRASRAFSVFVFTVDQAPPLRLLQVEIGFRSTSPTAAPVTVELIRWPQNMVGAPGTVVDAMRRCPPAGPTSKYDLLYATDAGTPLPVVDGELVWASAVHPQARRCIQVFRPPLVCPWRVADPNNIYGVFGIATTAGEEMMAYGSVVWAE